MSRKRNEVVRDSYFLREDFDLSVKYFKWVCLIDIWIMVEEKFRNGKDII